MVGNRMQGKWLSTSSCCVFTLERLTVTLLQQQPKHPQICQPAAKNKQSSSPNPKGISSAYCLSLACRLQSTQLHQGVNTHHGWIMVVFCSFLVSLPPSRKIHDLFTKQSHCINWVLLHKDSPRKKNTLGRWKFRQEKHGIDKISFNIFGYGMAVQAQSYPGKIKGIWLVCQDLWAQHIKSLF